MSVNVGTFDRIVRLVLGLALVIAPFFSGLAMFEGTLVTAISVVVGVILLATAAMRVCPIYSLLGLHTGKA